METKSVRVNQESHSAFINLCKGFGSKNIQKEVSKSLDFFAKMNILPSDYNKNYEKNIVGKLESIETKIEKQNSSFDRFTYKILDRQFAFLKEHEKKMISMNENYNNIKNTEKHFSILLQNVYYVYELLSDMYEIFLGYYDFGENSEIKYGTENEKILFLINNFNEKIKFLIESSNELIDS